MNGEAFALSSKVDGLFCTHITMGGWCLLRPVLMVQWWKGLPLTACCLTPLSGIHISARSCEKIASDLG